MTSNRGRRTLKTTLVCLLTYAMVWSGIPVPALTQMAQAVESDDVEVEVVAEETPTGQEVLVTQGESDSDEAEPEGGETIESVSETVVVPNADNLPSNDELFAGYVQQLFDAQLPGADDELLTVQDAGQYLTGNNLAIYEFLKQQVQLVAAGGQNAPTTTKFTAGEELLEGNDYWTAAELGVSSLIEEVNGENWVTAEAADAILGKLAIDRSAVWTALLADCPYDLYWHDKTKRDNVSAMIMYSNYDLNTKNGSLSLKLSSLEFDLLVSSDYAVAGQYYKVDSSKISTVTNAVSRAVGIANEHKDKLPKARLEAYKDAICNATKYNDAAAEESNNTPYGNPWQLVHVFDNDPNTMVVCEGYSKAFKYLCDLSGKKDIECILATGRMAGGTGAGPHMWNIVRMDDGKNYLVDVTNCDEGTIGAPDQLFLAPYYSVEDNNGITQYNLSTIGGMVSYMYDSKTVGTFGADDLAISSTAYVAPPALTSVVVPTAAQNLTYNGSERTGVAEGIGYTLSGVCAATNADSYTATATLNDGYIWSDQSSEPKTIVWSIAPKPVTVTANNQSKVYGDEDPNLSATVSGTLGTDTVSYTVSRAEGEDVGEYAITPAGDAEQGNYAVTYVPGKLTITKRTIMSQNTTVTFSPTSYKYMGVDQSPVPAVECDGKTLSNGTDFTCSYISNRNVGTATVTVTGKGNYGGSATGTFEITKAPLTITANDCSVLYGNATEFAGVAYDGLLGADTASCLIGELSFTCNREINSAAESMFSITPSGLSSENYNITFAAGTLTVIPRPVTLTWSDTEFDYDGGSHCPTATAGELINGDQATVTVTGAQTNAGTYTATATAVSNSNYCLPDNPTTSFVIKKAAITPSVSLSGWTYGDAPSAPSVQGNTGNGTVAYEYKVKGADDSTYSPEKPTNADDYVVKATISESTNHQGATATAEFKIAKASSSVAIVPVANEVVYTGSAQKLVSEGTATGGTMNYSTDQSTWSSKVPTATEAGNDYKVWYKVVGDRNHYDSEACGPIEVSIAKAANGLTVPSSQSVSKGSNLDVSGLVSGANGAVTYEVTQMLEGCSINEQGLFSAGSTSGTCVVSISAGGDQNHNSAQSTLSIKVCSGIEDARVTLGAMVYEYDGIAKTPGVTSVKIGETTLVPNRDYEVDEPVGCTTVGSYTYTVRGVGEFIGTRTATFRIEACDVSKLAIVAPAAQTYNGRALTPKPTVRLGSATLREGTDYALSYANNVNAGTATVTVTGSGNFAGAKSATFPIAKAPSSLDAAGGEAEVLFSKAKKKAQAIGGLVEVSGVGGGVTYAKVGGSGNLTVDGSGRVTVKKKSKKGTYRATVRVTAVGDANHQAASRDVTVTVKVVSKLTNPMELAGKTTKVKRGKSVAAKKLVAVRGAKGKVTYKKAGGDKSISVAKSGKLTVKKGCKPGTYGVKLKVTAAGNATYKKATKTVSCTVVVQ